MRVARGPVLLILATLVAAGCSNLPAHSADSRAPVPVRSAAAATAPVVAHASGADTYFAESQDAAGTLVREPACRAGCPLSALGTTVLYDMSWQAWTGSEAVGTGRESIHSCVPDCSLGGQYTVPVTVRFGSPVRDCAGGTALWLWSRASFRFPRGLPVDLQDAGAPAGTWNFTSIRAQASQSCRTFPPKS